MGVILAVVLIYFTGIQMIDPILSMVIAVVILRGGYKIMRNAVSILMESVPEHLDTDEIMDDMKRVDQVLDVHEFHLWSITTEHYSLSAHVVLDSKSGHDAYETINKLERLLKEKYGLSHTTLQIEHLEMNHLDEAYFEEIK